jgi:hypothetical protein
MYDRAPNRVERLEMIYRYKLYHHADQLVNNMIGNSKNTDSEKRVSIEPIRKEDSKIFSDSLKTQLDIFIGKQSETSQPCLKLWLSASLLFGFWPFGK